MSMLGPEKNDNSSSPEDDAPYRYGNFYFHLRDTLRRIPSLTVKAYLPNSGGIKTVTNRNTANGSIRIVEGKNLREPDESELMYFTQDTLEQMGLDFRRLKVREDTDFNPDKTGVYRKIDPKTLQRILNEPSAQTPEQKEKVG